jgi:hypothetical protein
MIQGYLFMQRFGKEIFFPSRMQNSPLLPTRQLQKGLPNGYDATTIKNVIPGFSNNDLVNYSEPNTELLQGLIAPTVIQSYAEVEFLLAEASARGWMPAQLYLIITQVLMLL